MKSVRATTTTVLVYKFGFEFVEFRIGCWVSSLLRLEPPQVSHQWFLICLCTGFGGFWESVVLPVNSKECL